MYRSLAGQPFGTVLWEHARRMTTERSGPRPAEADIARNIADLLNRAHDQDLTPEEAFERALRLHVHKPGSLLPSPTTFTGAPAATSCHCPT